MSTGKTIDIPSGVVYLNEVMDSLPKNVIFNKGKTGCGGTSIALENSENYIIAVPFKALAENKAKQSNGRAFAFTGTTTSKDLDSYLKNNHLKKILVTYDSLEKLIATTGTAGFNLLVDESHLLFTNYDFRTGAIQKVLKNYKAFDSFTFMTATNLEVEFLLEELKGIPLINAVWEDKNQVIVQSVKCKYNVKSALKFLIEKFLSGAYSGNAYIFINSVKLIKELVTICNLTDENAKAIWSSMDSDTGLIRSTPEDEPKKINFFTSSCFEGVDLHDPEGKIIIVSDHSMPHTMLDVSTSILQIAGRIRDSKFKNKITYLYSQSEYSEMSYDEYKEAVEKEQALAENTVKALNMIDQEHRKLISPDINYIKFEDGTFKLDSNRIKLELHQFKVIRHLYSNEANLSDELIKNGFIVKNFISNHGADEVWDSLTNQSGNGGRTLKEVITDMEKWGYNGGLSIRYLEDFEKYPFLEEAVKILGIRTIKKHKCSVKAIKKLLIGQSDIVLRNKIVQLLDMEPDIKPGSFISSSKLKELLQTIYKSTGNTKKATASDINIYYDAEETSRKIHGKSVKGFKLKTKRFI